MRRTTPLRAHGVRTSDPFVNLSAEQLQYIGAIAMLYNDVEGLVNDLCGAGLRIPIRDDEVLTRINGIEGKVKLVKLCAKHWGFSDNEMNLLCETLGEGGFGLLKKWRDGVIHARVFDMGSGVGKMTQKQGRTEDILLALEALKGLYERLDWMRAELFALLPFMQRKCRIARGEIDDQHKERLEQENEAAWTQYLQRRNQRLSLPPMPEFPEDTPDLGRMREAFDRHAGTR
jgi:hypothetical protein